MCSKQLENLSKLKLRWIYGKTASGELKIPGFPWVSQGVLRSFRSVSEDLKQFQGI